MVNYLDNGLSAGTYYYQVAAVGVSGEGTFSNEASATPGVALLPAPVLHGVPDSGQMALTWTAVTGAASYNIYRTSSYPPVLFKVNVSGTSFTDTGLSNGSSYFYIVYPVCKDGQGQPSNGVSTANPVITATVPANPTVITWNPATMTSVPLSVNVAGFYAPNQVVGVTIYDTMQTVIKNIPTKTVTLGGVGSNGTVTVPFVWDGTTNQSDGSGGYVQAVAGVYLYKFEVNPASAPTGNSPPPPNYDSDKSTFLRITAPATDATLISDDGTTAVYNISYTLNSIDNPARVATQGKIDVYDPLATDIYTYSMVLGDLTPGMHTVTISIPSPVYAGTYLFLVSSQDKDNDNDKANRLRYALQHNMLHPAIPYTF